VTTFSATVHQNVYLPRGTSAVHAIVAVGTGANGADGRRLIGAEEAVEVILLDCSGSMGTPWTKLEAARTATGKAIDQLPDGTWFAIVAGTAFARPIYPEPRFEGGELVPSLALASEATRAGAKLAIARLGAGGGTAISNWLAMARQLFESRPAAINHAFLLTDGRDEGEERARLTAEVDRCLGLFQCDCRGFGTDWDRRELQAVSDALLGTTDIISEPSQMDSEFEAIMQRSVERRIGALYVQVLTPLGGTVRFFKQVSPEVLDLSERVAWQQPAGPEHQWQQVGAIDPGLPLASTYSTGAWANEEEREYHLCLSVVPQQVGAENELRAARVALIVDGRYVCQTPVRACWTDDTERTTRIDRAVAHYTGQEELARSIEEGLEARRSGDYATATQRLGRAVQLAAASGNEQTTRLLLRVVDIDDPREGTVRLKAGVSKEDEMTLDTRSRRTVRLNRPREL